MMQIHVLQILLKLLWYEHNFLKHVEYHLFTVSSVIGWQMLLKTLSSPLAKLKCLSQDLFWEKNLGALDIRRLVTDTPLSYERILEHLLHL